MQFTLIHLTHPHPSTFSHLIHIKHMLSHWSRLSRRFSTTIFDKILAKNIPSQAVYED
jgi:hypothetical protein